MNGRQLINRAFSMIEDSPEDGVRLRIHGYPQVRILFEEDDAVVQIMDTHKDHTIVGDVQMVEHLVCEIARVCGDAFRERRIHTLQAQACQNVSLQEEIEKLHREAAATANRLKVSEHIRAALERELERHLHPREVFAVTQNAKEKVKQRHPECF